MSAVAATSKTNDEAVVKRRHFGRWISAAFLLLVVALTLRSVATNPRFHWGTVAHYLFDPRIIKGMELTLLLTAVCMLIALALGMLLATMRLSQNRVAQAVASAYVSFFRGTPILVQLIFWFNVSALYPKITFGLPGVAINANKAITPIAAAILGLGLHEAAYTAEIFRGGINSVDSGQSEAAHALGLSRGQILRRVVLPQAMATIVPPIGNEVIGMLKTTSLVSVLAVSDLLYSAQLIYSQNFQTIPLLLTASIWYLVLTFALTALQSGVERYYARSRTQQRRRPRAATLAGMRRQGL